MEYDKVFLSYSLFCVFVQRNVRITRHNFQILYTFITDKIDTAIEKKVYIYKCQIFTFVGNSILYVF